MADSMKGAETKEGPEDEPEVGARPDHQEADAIANRASILALDAVNGPGSEGVKRELSEQQKESILRSLKERFEANLDKLLYCGVEWEHVRSALLASSTALWILWGMEITGHEPTMIQATKEGFKFCTLSPNTPESTRDSVYDKAAVTLNEGGAGIAHIRSAVEDAQRMGLQLIPYEDYYKLQHNSATTIDHGGCSSWILTPNETRRNNKALVGRRTGRYGFNVWREDVGNSGGKRGWRGVFVVPRAQI